MPTWVIPKAIVRPKRPVVAIIIATGSYVKKVDSNYGPVDVTVPRDRQGTFLPTMVPEGSRRLTDVDDMIISLYAGGMTVRDIQHHMATAMGPDPRKVDTGI